MPPAPVGAGIAKRRLFHGLTKYAPFAPLFYRAGPWDGECDADVPVVRHRSSTARAAAAVLSLATIALWVVFIAANPFSAQGLTLETVAVALIMAALAAAGLVAAVRKRPVILVLAAGASFLPVGLYLLGVPSVFRLIGVANLLCLLLGLIMWRTRQAAASTRHI